jgi:hypothetical protein
MMPHFRPDRQGEAVLLLLFGFLLCLAFLKSPGTTDVSRWLLYMDLARQKGLFSAYPIAAIQPIDPGGSAFTTDYPPLSFLILGLFSRIADIFQMSDFAALKISLLLFALACAAVTALFTKPWQPFLAVAMFAVLFVSAILQAYTDVYLILFLLLALYSYRNGYLRTGTVLFAISCLVKWQPIILSPLILLYVVPQRPKLADLAKFAPAALFVLIVLLAYARPIFFALISGVRDADIKLSGNALNLNWIITGLIEGCITTPGRAVTSLTSLSQPVSAPHVYSYLLLISSVLRYLCYSVSLYYFYISDRSLLSIVRASIVCFMAYFTFGYGVHENHACVPAVLAIFWFMLDRSRYLEATLLGVMFNANLLIFYGFNGGGLGFSRIVGWDATLYLAGFNLVLFVVLWIPVANRVTQKWLALSGLAGPSRMKEQAINENGVKATGQLIEIDEGRIRGRGGAYTLEVADTGAGSYQRTLQTKAGDVNLKIPELRR